MHDLKIGRLELWWFVDFDFWGLGVHLGRVTIQPSYKTAAFAFGPIQFGVDLF